MSTVLTNGIIIPDNGSRNWGGDLANNWNILDVNVGYMTDVKNRVSTLENSVAENTANIQNNASNISALQTSKQDTIEDLETIRAGATAGATAVQPSELTSKANDADVVHKSGDETIAGVKKFSDTIIGIDNFNLQSGGTWDGGARLTLNKKTESMSAILQTFSDADNSAYVYDVNNFYPYSDNKNNLGTSTNKWKTFNGINPGALSLPSDASITIDTTSFKWGKNFTFTPAVNGHLFINIDSSTGTRMLSLKTSRGEYVLTNQQGIMRFTTSVYENKAVTILINSSITETVIPALTLFPCQGNV